MAGKDGIMADLKFLRIFGAILLFCATGSPAFAGNESTYTAAADGAAVLCSYNQRDTVFFKPHSAVLIPPGESAQIGCNAGKPIFSKHRADRCRIRGIPSVPEQQIQMLVSLKSMAGVFAGAASGAGALWSAIKATASFEHDIAKNLCKNMMGVINAMPYLGMVKSGSTVELSSSGMLVK